MIKHIVMWKVKKTERTKEENIYFLKKNLDNLKDIIPQVIELETGINFSSSPKAFDLILLTTFSNIDDLNNYRNHPEHKKIVELLNKLTEEVAVVDYET